jgi:uncharacterized protein
MKLRDWAFLLGSVGAGMLVYGALYEADRLVVEHRTLRLRRWPKRLNGFRIALLADFHLRDIYSLELSREAVSLALDEAPDMVVLAGDFVGYWKEESIEMLADLLEPFLLMNGSVVAVPGNHDYWGGTPELFAPIFEDLNIRLLRNESWRHAGITWVGLDSANVRKADPVKAFEDVEDGPVVVVWHEPDPVDTLPQVAALQLSGHSHGGQFRFPGGFTPMHTKNGRKYVRGFHPEAATPVYVSRGIGTTGPPSRFMCPPEVAILTLVSEDR